MSDKKYKSNLRWEAGHHIHNIVLPSLTSPSECAVVMACWFYAKGSKCVFDCSAKQIASVVKLSTDRVQKLLQRLERGDVIETLKLGWGRDHPSVRRITGRPFNGKKVVASDHLSK